MKLTHVRLLVNDFDTCFRFYRDVMGFAVQWGAEGSDYAAFRGRGEGMVALFSRQSMADTLGAGELPPEAECQDRTMLVFEAADLDAKVEALKARGALFVADPQDRPDWGMRTAHLRDPEGNLIELNSPLPGSQWSDELVDEAERYAGPGGDSSSTEAAPNL
jgi:catechol 2,3-dioxygenase-like lactoylglutathione lyase family enzyme